MSDVHPPRRPGRSFGAVFAGLVAVFVLSLGTDALLHVIGIFPPLGQAMTDQLFVLATAYRTVYGVVGGYVTARLAPDRPMRHALIGGVMGLVLGTIGAVATWNHVPSLGPHWYPLAIIASAIPCAWLGGKLREIQNQTS
jgi:hypothetical protein